MPLRRREKDGLWAVLAWLSILAHVNHDSNRNLMEQIAKKAPGGIAHSQHTHMAMWGNHSPHLLSTPS